MTLIRKRALHLRIPRPVFYAIAVLLPTAILLVFYLKFFAVTENQRIERLLDRAARAIQAESVIRLGDVLAMNYMDASGADRSMVIGQAQRFFDEVTDLKVGIGKVIHEKLELSSSAEDARAIVIVSASGKTGSESFSGIGRSGADAFLVSFHKRDGTWKIIRSQLLSGKTPDELLKETGFE